MKRIERLFGLMHHVSHHPRRVIDQISYCDFRPFHLLLDLLFQHFEFLGDRDTGVNDIFYVLFDASCSLIHRASSFMVCMVWTGSACTVPLSFMADFTKMNPPTASKAPTIP